MGSEGAIGCLDTPRSVLLSKALSAIWLRPRPFIRDLLCTYDLMSDIILSWSRGFDRASAQGRITLDRTLGATCCQECNISGTVLTMNSVTLQNFCNASKKQCQIFIGHRRSVSRLKRMNVAQFSNKYRFSERPLRRGVYFRHRKK